MVVDPKFIICKWPMPFFANKNMFSLVFRTSHVYLSRGSYLKIFRKIFRLKKYNFAGSEKNLRGVSCWNPGGLRNEQSLHGRLD